MRIELPFVGFVSGSRNADRTPVGPSGSTMFQRTVKFGFARANGDRIIESSRMSRQFAADGEFAHAAEGVNSCGSKRKIGTLPDHVPGGATSRGIVARSRMQYSLVPVSMTMSSEVVSEFGTLPQRMRATEPPATSRGPNTS